MDNIISKFRKLIKNDIIFLNPTMWGLLRFNNNFYYFLDKVNNIFLRIISKLLNKFFKNKEICFYFNKNNYRDYYVESVEL